MTDAVNPEMVIVTLVSMDLWVGKLCPNCRVKFRKGDEVFESVDQATALHVTCVVALALVATLRPPSELAVAAEYEARRDELLDVLSSEGFPA